MTAAIDDGEWEAGHEAKEAPLLTLPRVVRRGSRHKKASTVLVMWVRPLAASVFYAHFLRLPPLLSLASPAVLTISWRSRLRLLPRQRNKQKSSNVENAKTNTVGENTTKQTFAAQVLADKTLGCCKTKSERVQGITRRGEARQAKLGQGKLSPSRAEEVTFLC